MCSEGTIITAICGF